MYYTKIFSSHAGKVAGMLALIPALLFSSCRKFVTIPPPRDQVVSATVFMDDETATAAILGIYIQMLGTVANGNMMTGALSTYPGLTSDEIYSVKSGTVYNAFDGNSILNTNGSVQNYLWRYPYAYIYQANACLEGLSASTTLSADVKKQLMGECLFVRAFCYFYLTGLFGDVPLEITTSYQTNTVAPRSASADVLRQVIRDLDSAQTLLSPAYPTSGVTRPNKWAATALGARARLYQQSWPAAEVAATAVISCGMYSLVTDLNSVFLANSKEAILQLQPVAFNLNTPEGALYIPASATALPNFAVPDTTLKAFEAGDQRKTSWLKSTTIAGVTYYYPYKYKLRSGSPAKEYPMIERLAEQYLIRAEARAQQNDLSGAIEDLDTIRVRAGLPLLPSTLDKAACLLAVEQEGRIELFMEWGHRWLDLRRTGRIDVVLGGEKSTWKPTDALYPIPFAEIQKNVFLTQNPGYE
jgi:hypothetical protein